MHKAILWIIKEAKNTEGYVINLKLEPFSWISN